MAKGSLNLAVDHSIVEQLADLNPVLLESTQGIIYERPYDGIPKVRRSYWYYRAIARKGNLEEQVLVRRAEVPLRGVVELFSRVSLTEKFNLVEGDEVTVEVRADRKVKPASA